jgi:hypothetical protein
LIARIFMPDEIADAVLDRVKHFTIGFGRAGETPAAKGSGVLRSGGSLPSGEPQAPVFYRRVITLWTM